MTLSARYLKVVMWSEEDQVFVGQCPGIVGPCCHGDDEVEVYHQLCEIVDDWIDRIERNGKPLPPATTKTDNADDVFVRIEAVRTSETMPSHPETHPMTDSARYLKVVMWSEEDQVFVGQCPGIIGSCCHGDDEVDVYRQLCEIVEAELNDLRQEGKPLPLATAKTDLAEDVLVRIEEAQSI